MTAGGDSNKNGPTGFALWWPRVQKLFSIRFFMACFLVAAIPSYLLGLLWEPLMKIAFWPIFVLAAILGFFNDDAVFYCPHCKKRMKVGADTCGHCGKSAKA
jgi:hypothetical protein